MRELKIEELQLSQGGCILTPAIVTGILGIVAGTVWLTNSIVNLYLYKSAERQPDPSPNMGVMIHQNLEEIGQPYKYFDDI